MFKRICLHIIFSIAILGAISDVFGAQKSSEKVEYFNKGGKVSSIPKNVIKNTEEFIKSATKADRNALSNVGRGLQKHSSRKGPFSNLKFSHKDANQTGERVLRDILNSKNKQYEYPKNGCIEIYDKVTGRGVSVSRNGKFNGFREFKDIT
jgi:hypothetical protein